MSFENDLLEKLNETISQVNDIDAKTGDEGAGARSRLNEMVRQNPTATTKAREIIQSVDEIDDEELQLLVARVLTTEGNKRWKTLVDAWVDENKTESLAPALSDEDKQRLAEERSTLVNMARALRTTLEAMGTPSESLPTVPSGRRGAKGKRGPMIRGYNFILDGNSHMVYTTFGKVIQAAGSNQKAAKEVLAKEGLEIGKLPEEWKFSINSHDITAFSKSADEPDLDDEEEDTDDDDFEDDED